jgi:hypothetical protein
LAHAGGAESADRSRGPRPGRDRGGHLHRDRGQRGWGAPGRFGGFLAALVGFGFSAYLTYLELFVIDAICQWCVASAVLMGLSLAVAAARAFAYTGRELTSPGIESPHGT